MCACVTFFYLPPNAHSYAMYFFSAVMLILHRVRFTVTDWQSDPIRCDPIQSNPSVQLSQDIWHMFDGVPYHWVSHCMPLVDRNLISRRSFKYISHWNEQHLNELFDMNRLNVYLKRQQMHKFGVVIDFFHSASSRQTQFFLLSSSSIRKFKWIRQIHSGRDSNQSRCWGSEREWEKE